MKLASIAALLIAAHRSLIPVHVQTPDSVSPTPAAISFLQEGEDGQE